MSVHVSAKHKAIGVPVRDDLKNLFPGAHILSMQDGDKIILPHIIDVTLYLRNIGIEAPAPVLSQYAWPHPVGQPPFDVQLKTTAMMTVYNRSYVLNGMGTGKTRSAIWAFDYLKSLGLANKMLVVAPLSTLDFVWAKEVFITAGHLKVKILHHGNRAKRVARLAEDADIYIVNHDGVKTLHKELLARRDIDTILVDEISTFRNNGADKSKAIQELVKHSKWAWGMTGSPTPGDPTDVYGQAKIISPSRVPKYFKRFRDALMTQVSPFKYVPRPNAVQQAFDVLQPAVRYTLDDVTELPPVIERMVDVPLGKEQLRIYKAMELHSYTMFQNGEITAVNAGALMNKLLQISCGYVYDSNRDVKTLDNDARLDQLVDDINACSEKVLVFVPFVHTLNGISERLTKEKIEHGLVHGGTPAQARANIFNLFQNTTKFKAIVAHPQCMAHGLTLTAATLVIWFAPIASLEIFDQANARIRRVGQKLKQLVLMYAATKMERRVYSILRAKQNVQNKILDLFEENSE